MTAIVWTPPFTDDEVLCLYFAERSSLSLEMVAAALAVPMATVEYILARARALRHMKLLVDPGSVPAQLWPIHLEAPTDPIPAMHGNSLVDAALSSELMTTFRPGS